MAFPHIFRRVLHQKFLFLTIFFFTCLLSIVRFRPPDIDHYDIVIDYNINQLLNITSFKYLLKTEQCQNYEYEKPLLGILIVTSLVKHNKLRMAHRNALPQCKLAELGFQRIFLLGDIPPNEIPVSTSVLQHEQNRFGDLLQGNFYDTYHNLTYKHVMGLRWASNECRRAKFIIKLDEDIIYDVYYLQSYLKALLEHELKLSTSNRLLSGVIIVASQPIRYLGSKWLAPPEEFSSSIYPYYISGYCYVTNALTAKRLVGEAAETPFFWIDDAWVIGIIKKYRLEIPLQSRFVSTHYSIALNNCCEKYLTKYGYNCEYKIGIANIYDTETVVQFQKSLELCYYNNV
ncbi:beta-1,3-galactosyltransferase 5-like [Teleopsis dalmanni]|uniref:beta-1,3-galactosyltransferase 5-like n=1 Tax=Teleopsis dalmanni TaxID=139649 RepID=UPI0018CD239A|nr:beta-1,3-galactosyltransferase 5-like [Teleopsis dalmanni]